MNEEMQVIEYLRNNPGCTKEDLVRGVINFSSKKTTLKILNELKREGVVTEEKEKRNSRAYKLFLHNEHILIALSKQITEFKQEFTKLLQKIEACHTRTNIITFYIKRKSIFSLSSVLVIEPFCNNLLILIRNCFIIVHSESGLIVEPVTRLQIRLAFGSFLNGCSFNQSRT